MLRDWQKLRRFVESRYKGCTQVKLRHDFVRQKLEDGREPFNWLGNSRFRRPCERGVLNV